MYYCLMDLLTDWFTKIMIYWLIDLVTVFIYCLPNLLTYLFTNWLIYCLTDLLTDWFTDLHVVIDWLSNWLIDRSIDFTDWPD